jgi:predicted ester cyclase
MSARENEKLYLRFAEIFNARDFDHFNEVMAVDFVDHHPGLVDVTGLATYRMNLAAVMDMLEMHADPEEVVGSEERVFTRIRLSGRHVGDFLGVPATGNPIEWYTHELWRVADGRFVERWAVDDLLTLLGQMGVELPTWRDAS